MTIIEDCIIYFRTRDLYKVLNVDRSATTAQIKAAYYRESLKIHPDKAQTRTKEWNTARFQVLAAVYGILSDERTRSRYDRTGNVEEPSSAASTAREDIFENVWQFTAFYDADVDLTKPFGMADVIFVVERKQLYYNRAFLAMRSPVFKRMFYKDPNRNSEVPVKLDNRTYNDVLALLKLLKLKPEEREIIIRDDNVEELFAMAVFYEMSVALNRCDQFILRKWKLSSNRVVDAFELAAKFKRTKVLEDLMNPGDHHSVFNCENIERILSIGKYHELSDVIEFGEKYLLENWKPDVDAVVRKVELWAKFGIKRAIDGLMEADQTFKQSNFNDSNVELLLKLSMNYPLPQLRKYCEGYFLDAWPVKGEKALRAVEIATQFGFPKVARKFIPLAAKRPFAEISTFVRRLSTECFSAILYCRAANEPAGEFKTYCFAGEFVTCCSQCGGAPSDRSAHKRCRCPRPEPAESVVEEMLKRAKI